MDPNDVAAQHDMGAICLTCMTLSPSAGSPPSAAGSSSSPAR
jgi:hypothetical protein